MTKKLKSIKSIVFVVILISVTVLGFLGYTEVQKFILKREGMAFVLNNNTSIYNQSTEESKNLLLDLKLLLDFSSNDEAKIQGNISKLESEIPKISDLSKSIDQSSNKLKKNDNQDSNNLYILFNEGLATKKATIDILNHFVIYEVCLVKNSSQQYQNINQFSEQLSKFSSTDDKVAIQDKVTMVSSAKNKISENITLMNELTNCFTDNYKKYFTIKMKDDIAKDIELYNKYADATNQISEGLGKSSSQLLQEGTAKLLDLKDKNPEFFNSNDFKNAIQDPKKLLQDQASILDNQEKKIKNFTSYIKSKYFLD